MRKYIELMIWAMLIIFNAACVDDKIEGLPAPSGDDDSYLNYEPIPLSKLKIEGESAWFYAELLSVFSRLCIQQL